MTKDDTFRLIRREVNDNHVVLFMKGTPARPRCGFSAQAAQTLNNAGIAYKSVDVLSDPALFDGIRQFPNYTHFPQMFVDGRFVGSSEGIARFAAKKSV